MPHHPRNSVWNNLFCIVPISNMAKSVQYDGAQDATAMDENEVTLRSRQQLGFVHGFRQEKLSDVDAKFDAGHSRQATLA